MHSIDRLIVGKQGRKAASMGTMHQHVPTSHFKRNLAMPVHSPRVYSDQLALAFRCGLAALAAGLICLLSLPAHASEAKPPNPERYAQISKLIRSNMHMGAHLQKAVTLKTVLAVRKKVSASDIPTLVQMLGDRDTNVIGSVAGELLVMLGEPAHSALEIAAHSADGNTRLNAKQALSGLADCASKRRRAELCP
jgi:hypothetical protein